MRPKFKPSVNLQKDLKKAMTPKKKKDQWWVLWLPMLYFGCYALGMASQSVVTYIVCYAIMALLLCPIFVYIVHEGVHGSIFRKKKYNAYILYTFDLIGGNSYNFKRRHLQSHHAYTNIAGWDTDIEQSGPIRLSSHVEHAEHHRYQHIYAFFLYPLYVFNWLVIRDFREIYRPSAEILKMDRKVPVMEKVKLLAFKAWGLIYLIILPAGVYGWSTAVLVFMMFTIIASLTALLALLPPHVVEDCAFPDYDMESLEVSWFDHQLDTTAHVHFRPYFLQYYYGFFNHHLTHHILPSVPWYQLESSTDELLSFLDHRAKPYHKIDLRESLVKHYRLLRRNGRAVDLWNHTM